MRERYATSNDIENGTHMRMPSPSALARPSSPSLRRTASSVTNCVPLAGARRRVAAASPAGRSTHAGSAGSTSGLRRAAGRWFLPKQCSV
eukprot:8566658-Pyramimonas_sp.AAC.1